MPLVREALVRGKDWKMIALQQAQTHFAKSKGVDKARVEAISKVGGNWQGG